MAIDVLKSNIQPTIQDLILTIKDEIRSYAVRKGLSIRRLSELLNARRGTTTSPQNLTKKLANSTLRYDEVKEIADVLGYEIVWVEKK